MNDAIIRRQLKIKLSEILKQNDGSILLEELGLRHGASVIDIALINDRIHGYEIKSAVDSLKRLPSQINIYNSVLDKVTLVTCNLHFEKAIELIPDWWGIIIAKENSNNSIYLQDLRRAKVNPAPHSLGIAKLLWRTEVLEILEEIGEIEKLKSKPRLELYNKLVKTTDLNFIRSKVLFRFKKRTNWLSD